MKPYQEQVFDIIESFSIFNGSVLELAKIVFINSEIDNIYPSNAAVSCINVANESYGSDLKDYFPSILKIFKEAEFRKRRPGLGKKLYINIVSNSEKIKENVDVNECKRIVEVILSGSKISQG